MQLLGGSEAVANVAQVAECMIAQDTEAQSNSAGDLGAPGQPAQVPVAPAFVPLGHGLTGLSPCVQLNYSAAASVANMPLVDKFQPAMTTMPFVRFFCCPRPK